MYANADSIRNKREELEAFITQHDIDIALICESLPKRTSEDKPSSPFIIKGFDYIENNEGRGVIVYFKETLDIKLIDDINSIYSPSLFFKVTSAKKPIHVAITYRSPNISKEADESFNKQIESAVKQLKNLVIYGDCNHPEIDWKYSSCQTTVEHPAAKFLHLVEENRISQLTKENTHFKPNCRPSQIDLVLTNNQELSNSIKMFPPLGKSHHSVILSKLNFMKDKIGNSERVKKYQYNKADFTAINRELGSVDWDNLINDEEKDVNAVWTVISEKILVLRDKHVPVSFIRTQKTSSKPIVINNSILHLIREKRWFFKKYKKYRTMTNYLNYCNARTRVNYFMRKERRNKETKIAEDIKNNPKKFYQYISSNTVKRDSIPDLINEDGSKAKTDEEKSSTLNQFFNSVFTQEDLSNIPNFEPRIDQDKYIQEAYVTESEMKKYLTDLKTEKSPGTDEIHPRLLKECAQNLAKPLKMFFDLTMQLGKVPDVWKKAEVRPIYKKRVKSQIPPTIVQSV